MKVMQRTGGEIEIDAELLSIGLDIYNDNDLSPDNFATFPNIECFYEDWGHTGICYRKKIVSTNAKPTLKVRLPESYDHVHLFELLFMKEYISKRCYPKKMRI